MPGFYVEAYSQWPSTGIGIRVHREKGFTVDQLSPEMCCFFFVEGEAATTKKEAIAMVVAYAGGIGSGVRIAYGKPKEYTPPKG